VSSDGSRVATVPLVGGRPVLDLVNTVSWRGDAARAQDHLQGPDDALVWSTRAGVLTREEADTLGRQVASRPAAGRALVEGLRALRTLVAGAVAGVPEPRTTDVEPEVLEALAHSRLVPEHPDLGTRGRRYRWEVTGVDEHTPRRRLALDLLDLLTDPRGPLGRCADPACGWVFEDTSRGLNRQWCSSSDCGNRNRVREHHRRHRAARG
jgi:predicted RNA-binding Zn ribbon-like protein